MRYAVYILTILDSAVHVPNVLALSSFTGDVEGIVCGGIPFGGGDDLEEEEPA